MTSGGSRSGVTLNALWVPVLPETSGLALGIEKSAIGAVAAWNKVTKGMGSAMAGELKRASQEGVVSLSEVSAAYKKVEQDKITQMQATNNLSKAERDLDTARSAAVAKSTELASVQQKVNQGVIEGAEADKRLAAANDAVAGAYNRVATAVERTAVAKAKDDTANKNLAASGKAAADSNDAMVASQSRSAGAMRALGTTGAVAFFGVAAGLAEAGKAAAAFEYSQTRLVSSAGETAEGLKVVNKGLLDMAGQVGYTADELSKGMYIVESAGFHGADGLKVMQAAAQGAKAEQADLTTVNNGLTTSLHDFHLSADSSADVMSKMVVAVGHGKTTFEEFAGALHSVEPVAGAANLKLEDIYGTLSMMTKTGMSADQATENMRNSINALMNPTQQMRDEMGKWGISADDVKEKLSERGLSGTMQYLTQTVQNKMGPAGKAVVSDMYQNAQATADANEMLKSMPPNVRAVAEAFQNHSITRKQYLADVKGSNAADSAQLQAFGQKILLIDGYSSNLKKNQSTVETYDQAVKTMTGTVAGQTVALAVSGENAKDTNDLIGQLNGTTKEQDGTVKGFNETQKTAKARWDDMKAAMHSARIEIGNAVLPALSGLATGLKDVAQFMEQHQGLSTTLIASVGTLGVVWAGWKLAMGTKALYTGIAEGVGALARNVSLARDATWGLNDASVAAEGSVARAGGAAATAAGEESLLADAGGRASVSEGLLAGTASAAAGAETRAAVGAGIASGAEAGLVGAGAGAAASTGVLAGAATGLAVGLRGIAASLPTIAAFAVLTGPLDHMLEKIGGGFGDILKKGEELTGTGFKSLMPWKWGIWDQIGKDVSGAFHGDFRNPSWMSSPTAAPPPPVQFSGSTAPDSGAAPQQIFPGSPFSIPAASDWTKAVGQAVISLPDEHTITIKNNSQEVMDNLKRLGIEVHELPGGKVELEAATEEAAKSFQDWVKDTTGKPVEVKVQAKPVNKDHSNWFGFPDDFKKLFGVDDNNPLQIPASLSPTLGTGGLPFSLPPAGSGGGVTPANPAAPGGPPPAPPPGVAPPAGSGGLSDILLPPGGGGVPGRGGGAPGGYAGVQRDVGGPEAWRGTVRSILASVGPSFGISNLGAWEDAIVAQIRTESGGNWAAKNNSDSNAQAGHPSQGILQFIPGTYDAWTAKTPFAGRPFPDPYAEIAAAIPYVLEKYGMRADGGPNHIGQGIGFQTGGWVDIGGGLGEVVQGTIDETGWQGAKPAMQKLALSYWATKAAQAEGVDPNRAVPALLDVISRESGHPGVRGTGDPNIVNLWDINAKGGDPSIGLAQVTQGTAEDKGNANLPGANLSDPITNLRAALRHAKSRGLNIWDVPEARGQQVGYQRGGFNGHVDGPWTPGRDSVHAVLEQGEFVTQRSRAQHMMPFLRWGNNAPIPQLQKMMGLMGFQGGAEVGGQGGDDAGVTPEILAVEKIANQFGLRLTAGKSGHGTHDTDQGYHDSGEAGDFGNGLNTAQEDAFAAYMIQNYGANLAEVIYTSPQLPKLIKDGQLVDPQQVYGPWLPEHHDHVHVAVKPGAFGGVGGYQAGSAQLPAAPGPGGVSSISPMSTGSGGGGGGGAAGYAPSQYPGYWTTPSGSYIPEEDVPNKGTYGGATQAAIDSALKSRDNANDQIAAATDRIAKLQAERDKLLHPEPAYPGAPAPEAASPEQIAEKDKEIANAQKAAADAKASAADANAKYTEVLNKPPEPGKGGSKTGRTSDSNVQGFGGDLVKGAMQSLGFDGSVFEDPTQWGIWKLFTSGVNFLGSMGKTIAEKGAPGLGISPMQAGDQGLPFGIGQGGAGDILGGVSSALGIQLPANAASTVSLQPGMPGGPPGAVSAPGTIQPGDGGVGPGGVPIPNALDGGGVPQVDLSSHVTFNGVTDTDKLQSHMAGVGIKKSRALAVGAPNGGIRML